MNTSNELSKGTGKSLESLKLQLGDDGELTTEMPEYQAAEASEQPQTTDPGSTGAASAEAAFDALFAADPSTPAQDIPTDTPSMLRRAAKLIKDGDRAGAKKIVVGVLSATKQNADAWYLYAYLIDDRNQQIQALNRALSLNPAHERARHMLASLRLSTQGDLFEDILPMAEPQVIRAERPAKRDDLALIVGFLCAAFLGLFGVSHFMKGKVASGVAYLLLGFAWVAIATTISAMSALCLAPIFIALHLYLAWLISKQGATETINGFQVV